MRAFKKLALLLIIPIVFISSCSSPNNSIDEGNDNPSNSIQEEYNPTFKDFNNLSGSALENNIDYQMMYKPVDGYVGDVMPYYENGTFYLFYLKDQGNSFNHSIFLVETKDFYHYEDKGLILESSHNDFAQDNWIGTGSVCKVDNDYYFFYTGHNEKLEIHERIMVAKSEKDLYHFNKLDGIYIDPINEVSRIDFRDPDVAYNTKTQSFDMTITTNIGGASIVKYTVSKDLSNYTYNGIIHKNTTDGFFNLECSDTFKINNNWYLSYSGQDDTLWVAQSNRQYEGYGSPYRIESKYFYAPKAVSDGKNTYMVGWARRKSECKDDSTSAWAGNMLVSKVSLKGDGTLYLSELETIKTYFDYIYKLPNTDYNVSSNTKYNISRTFESYMLEGDFRSYTDDKFGFEIGSSKGQIVFNMNTNQIEYRTNNGTILESSVSTNLLKEKQYHFVLISEGSIVTLYVTGFKSITTRFYGAAKDNIYMFSSGGNLSLSNLSIRVRTK